MKKWMNGVLEVPVGCETQGSASGAQGLSVGCRKVAGSSNRPRGMGCGGFPLNFEFSWTFSWTSILDKVVASSMLISVEP